MYGKASAAICKTKCRTSFYHFYQLPQFEIFLEFLYFNRSSLTFWPIWNSFLVYQAVHHVSGSLRTITRWASEPLPGIHWEIVEIFSCWRRLPCSIFISSSGIPQLPPFMLLIRIPGLGVVGFCFGHAVICLLPNVFSVNQG